MLDEAECKSDEETMRILGDIRDISIRFRGKDLTHFKLPALIFPEDRSRLKSHDK